MNRKAKGTRAERELLHQFWATEQFVVMRAPASGAIKYPCPDLLVGNHTRKLAIECKSCGNSKQYLTEKEVNELKEFSRIFGAEPWIAVRFLVDMQPEWFFMTVEDLQETNGGNFVISIETAQRKGLLFDEVIQ